MDDLEREVRKLDRERKEGPEEVAGRQAAIRNRRDALRSAYEKSQRGAAGPEAAFRLTAELDRALAALAAEAEGVERAWAERERELDAERERVTEALRVARDVFRELTAAKRDYGLAPWDGVALRAARMLRGEGDVEGEGNGKASLRAHEVVAVFKERVGVGRSAFYARYRPLLRAYPLGPVRVVRPPEGGLVLLGLDTAVRFRRAEVEALIRFLEENRT